MEQLLQDAARRALRYLHDLPDRPVAPRPEAVAGLARLDIPLPDKPIGDAEVLALLDEVVGPATTATPGPRYFGFVMGGSLPAALAANWLAGAWDQNPCLGVMSPGTVALEEVALRWMVDVLGLPAGTAGGFVTGATMANLTGLAAARHRVLAEAGWDVETQGLFGAPPVTVVIGDEAHASLLKALSLLGFGRDRVVRVRVDGQGRMRPALIPSLTGPAIVCTQAGNVNTGAVDPLAAICEQAHADNAWVHVDGAFGLWAAASPALRDRVDGIGYADSWATDAHKWLNVPYDSGLAFVRDPAALRAAMGVTAAYLPTEGPARNPSDYTPEMSRRARGVEVWAALASLGRAGLAELVERNCRYARRFADELSAAGYPVLNEVTLNQVLVSFGDAERTGRVIARIQSDGVCWCGGTVWQGRPAMRISVSNWSTTDEDVTRSIAAIRTAAEAVA
jgi:glutamate/tyrosine decarboxylase-like PLP-dependent enzyme